MKHQFDEDYREELRDRVAEARELQLANKGSIGPIKGNNPNNLVLQARIFAKAFLDSPQYRESIARRILNDTLPPGVEQMLWHYSFGKPKENIQVTLGSAAELKTMTDEQLEARAEHILRQIREQRQLKRKSDIRDRKDNSIIDAELTRRDPLTKRTYTPFIMESRADKVSG